MSNVLKLRPTSDETLKPDPFWDGKSGGGVRCSSEGAEGNYYHDPRSVGGFESSSLSGRSVASLLPGLGCGLTGVVVPRATWWGSSRGFDAQRPRLMNVDPDVKGQASVVDVSQCSKEAVANAYELAWQQVGGYGDPRLVAAQAYRNLAIGTEPVGMDEKGGGQSEDRVAPLGGLDTYVVPKAALGGGQIVPMRPSSRIATGEIQVSPSVTPGPPPRPKADQDSVLAFNRPEDPSKMSKAQYRQAARESSQTLMQKLGVQRQPGSWTEEEQQQVVVLREQPGAPTNGSARRPQPTTESQPVFQEQQRRPHNAPQALSTPQTAQAPTLMPQAPPASFTAQQTAGDFRDQTSQREPGQYAEYMLQKNVYGQTPATPPTTEVVFEIEGWGQIPLAYHKVIRSGGLLVLGWDKRWPTGKSFPPSAEKVMAAHVRGTNKVFYVHSTGSTFEDADTEYCILLIAKEIGTGQE